MEEENKRFYLTIKGQEVDVSEEVYRAYKSADRAERKRKQRMWRCLVPREKANKSFLKRCTQNCSKCPYGRQVKNSVVSLDTLKDSGYEEVDTKQNLESNYIANEEYAELYAAIKRLTSKQQELVRLIYFENKKQYEVAEMLGVSQQAISKSLGKILMELKLFFDI